MHLVNPWFFSSATSRLKVSMVDVGDLSANSPEVLVHFWIIQCITGRFDAYVRGPKKMNFNNLNFTSTYIDRHLFKIWEHEFV